MKRNVEMDKVVDGDTHTKYCWPHCQAVVSWDRRSQLIMAAGDMKACSEFLSGSPVTKMLRYPRCQGNNKVSTPGRSRWWAIKHSKGEGQQGAYPLEEYGDCKTAYRHIELAHGLYLQRRLEEREN